MSVIGKHFYMIPLNLGWFGIKPTGFDKETTQIMDDGPWHDKMFSNTFIVYPFMVVQVYTVQVYGQKGGMQEDTDLAASLCLKAITVMCPLGKGKILRQGKDT